MTEGEEGAALCERSPSLADGHAFTVGVEHRAGAVVLTPRGELDCDTAPEFERVYVSVVRPDGGQSRPRRLVVDCAGLAFCDSSGLNALLRAQQLAEELGAELRLADVPGIVARLLDVTGITAVLRCDATVADAVGE